MTWAGAVFVKYTWGLMIRASCVTASFFWWEDLEAAEAASCQVEALHGVRQWAGSGSWGWQELGRIVAPSWGDLVWGRPRTGRAWNAAGWETKAEARFHPVANRSCRRGLLS